MGMWDWVTDHPVVKASKAVFKGVSASIASAVGAGPADSRSGSYSSSLCLGQRVVVSTPPCSVRPLPIPSEACVGIGALATDPDVRGLPTTRE